MPIGITMLQHTVYRQSDLVWVDDMDPVWIITMAPFWSYNIVQFITVLYSDSTFSYIQFRPMIHFFGICRHDIR